jgi:hypothetical protein
VRVARADERGDVCGDDGWIRQTAFLALNTLDCAIN